MTFSAPNTSSDVIQNEITAGEYYGIALDTGRISEKQMTDLKTKLETTKAKLEAEDFTELTKDDILGDLLYTTALSFYALLDVMDYVQAKTMNVLAIRLPSEAHFSYELSVYSVFGVPMSVSSGGLAMDVDRQYSMVKAFDGDTEKPKQFFLSSGANGSALEHSVPEQLFSTSENPAEGISAVKALKIANEQGIPIYTINQTNINTILPNLQLDSETITDIQNAVNAGKTVTAPKTDITYNGWTGHGYIIIDPETGAGAYMIAGGMSGAIILIALLSFLIPIIVLLFVSSGPVILLIGGGLLIWSMWKYVDKIKEYLDKMERGLISPEEAKSRIEIRSILTIIVNTLSLLGKESEFRLLGVIMVALAQLVFDGIDLIFDDVSTW